MNRNVPKRFLDISLNGKMVFFLLFLRFSHRDLSCARLCNWQRDGIRMLSNKVRIRYFAVAMRDCVTEEGKRGTHTQTNVHRSVACMCTACTRAARRLIIEISHVGPARLWSRVHVHPDATFARDAFMRARVRCNVART